MRYRLSSKIFLLAAWTPLLLTSQTSTLELPPGQIAFPKTAEKPGFIANCSRITIEVSSANPDNITRTLKCFDGSEPNFILIGTLDLTDVEAQIVIAGPPPPLPSAAPKYTRQASTPPYAATAHFSSRGGDFTGDGIDDFVTVPRSGNSMILRVGLPNGTFAPDRLLAVGGYPRIVAPGRLTADGRFDFVVGHASGISVIAATGPATYAPARELPAGGRVDFIYLADFNNDNRLDIAAVVTGGKALLVFLNSGGGNFAAPTTVALPDEAANLVAGDLNGDNRPDLILTSASTAATPLLMATLNNGNGAFGPAVTSPLPGLPAFLGVTDTNGDNRLDAIVRLASGLISVHTGDAAGRFTRLSVHSGGYFFGSAFDFLDAGAAGRFVVTPGSGDSYLLADKIEAGGSLTSIAAVAFPGYATATRVADLNGDSQPDIVAAGDGGFGRTGGLWVRLSQANGRGYSPATLIGALKPSAIEVLDLNGDKFLDIVALESTGRGATCSIVINNGNGTFAAPLKVWDQPNNDFFIYRLLAADWNNDQRPDIALIGDTSLHTLVNGGNSTFRPAATYAVPNRAINAILGDTNSDGLPDLLVMTGSRPTVQSGRNPVLIQYLAQADGSFRPPTDVLTSSVNALSTVLALADVNNDKIPDIVYGATPDLSFDTVRFQIGQPGGGYREGTVLAGINSLTLADVDGDGTLDGVNAANDLRFYRGRGDGTFGSPFRIPGGGTLSLANLNGDSKADFAVIVPDLESFVLLIPSNLARQNNATITSAATTQVTIAAPASIVTVYGPGLATATESTQSALWSESLAGTTATVRSPDGILYPARLAFVSPTQVNLLIPSQISTNDPAATASVQVSSASGILSTGPVALRRISPSIFFAGDNLAAANLLRSRPGGQAVEEVVTRENGQPVPIPIDLGPESEQIFLLLYGTGIRNRVSLNQVTATISGVPAPVLFAGNQGQFPGVDQINFQIPRSLAGRGLVDIVIRVEGIAANTVRVAIR